MNRRIQKGGGLVPPPCVFMVFLYAFLFASTGLAQAPDTLWTSYYDDGDANWREQCYRLIQTEEGGFLIVGSTSTPGANRQWYPAYYVVKTDADGVETWSRYFDVSRRHDMLGGIAQGSNGQFFIAGYYQDGPLFANTIKMDSNGDSLWSADIENGEFTNVISTIDGNILACGVHSTQLVKTT